MPRNPAQDAALDRSYQRRRATTREAFVNAMDRLIRGEPLYTDGKHTGINLCREAKRSRSTLNRYPDIKKTFADAKNIRNRTAPVNLIEKISELEETISHNRRKDHQNIRELKSSRDRFAQETFVLYRIVKLLQRENEELKTQLREALRGVRLHIVGVANE